MKKPILTNILTATIVMAGLQAALACFFLTGCATATRIVQERPTTARLTVQAATFKVIDGDADRAARVSSIVSKAKTALDGQTATTVAALESIVREEIEWSRLDLSDTMLVNLLLEEVTAGLERRLGPELFDHEGALVVSTVLGWIEDAAAMATTGRANFVAPPTGSRGSVSAAAGVFTGPRSVVSAPREFVLLRRCPASPARQPIA